MNNAARLHALEPDPPPAPAPSRKLSGLAIAWDDNPRRSLIIGMCGAAIGLVLAGVSLFNAKGTTVHGVPPEDVALVNGRPILASDYEAQMQTEFGVSADVATPGQRAALLNEMIREELFVQRGLELDEPSVDPDTRAALVAAVEQQVVVDATAQTPGEADLRAFYDQRRDHYSTLGSIAVRDLVGPQAAAAQASAALKAGQPVEAVMARLGLKDTGKVNGEELYFAAQLHLGAPLFAAARTLPAGGVSAPIAAADGVHVLVVTTNIQPVAKAFEAARPQVFTDYKSALQKRMQAGELQYLRDKADIQVAKAYQ